MSLQLADEIIINKIYLIRGQKVMLDEDLSLLYGVSTKRLNEQVKRNAERFPTDFMFQLIPDEFNNLKSQIATSSWGGRRKLPFAFTEHGIVMLSGILNSSTAIQVNVQIIRIFIKLREMILTHKDILLRLEQLEKEVNTNKEDIRVIFQYVKELLNPASSPRRKIGFIQDD